MDKLGNDWIRNIILTNDKTVVKADILIDDKPVITGVENPEWEHIIFDQPYNRQIKDKRRIDWGNWKSVIEFDTM